MGKGSGQVCDKRTPLRLELQQVERSGRNDAHLLFRLETEMVDWEWPEERALNPALVEAWREEAWQFASAAQEQRRACLQLGEQNPKSGDPYYYWRLLRRALDHARDMMTASNEAEALSCNMMLRREIAWLMGEIAQAEPEELAEEILLALGATEPHVHEGEARAAWIAYHQRKGVPVPPFPRQELRKHLEASVYGYDPVTHLELVVMRERLQQALALLERRPERDEPMHRSEVNLRERLLRKGVLALAGVDAYLDMWQGMRERGLPEPKTHEQLRPGRLYTTISTCAMLAQQLHNPEMRQLIKQTDRMARICREELEAQGIPTTPTFFVPTRSREEFEALFPPDRDAKHVRGAFLPHVGAVVLSPGHVRLMCRPQPGMDLYPVHLHELAHACAHNWRAALQDPLEKALAEAHAEEVTALAIPGMERRMSQLSGFKVRYEPSRHALRERQLLRELIQLDRQLNNSIPNRVLGDLTRAESMLELITHRIFRHLAADDQQAEGLARATLDSFLRGDDEAISRVARNPVRVRSRRS